MLLDAFLNLAVPFFIIVLIGGTLFMKIRGNKPVYDTEEGKQFRDETNKRYKTNRGTVIIGLVSLAVYGLVVASLFEELGNKFFTYVISLLVALPAFGFFIALVLVYHLIVHGRAHLKKR